MKQIGSIQILRAIAALMVVVAHAQDDALGNALKMGLSFTKTDALPWDAGVDLFFVISGFIMVHASHRLFGTQDGIGIFLQRRLIRIVPLYWLLTTIAVAVMVVGAVWGSRPFASLGEIVSSYGFIPFGRPHDGAPRPLAAQGWTLNYEMFFYVVFAAFIWCRREIAVGGVTLVLLVAVLLGQLFHPTQTALAYWSDPIVLEFAIGMGIALAFAHGIRAPRQLAAPLVVLALVVLAMDFAGMSLVANFGVKPNGFSRLFACGLPMAVVFGAIVLTAVDVPAHSKIGAFLCRLGDASYALYLFHPLVIVLTRKIYVALGLAQPLGFWPLVLADLPIASLMSLVVHAMIETPTHDRLGAWFRTRRVDRQRRDLDRSIPSTSWK